MARLSNGLTPHELEEVTEQMCRKERGKKNPVTRRYGVRDRRLVARTSLPINDGQRGHPARGQKKGEGMCREERERKFRRKREAGKKRAKVRIPVPTLQPVEF
jgi:hypothetical protein